MNVLITGAGGFIGSHLVDSQLARGYRVTALDLHTDRLEQVRGNQNLTIIKGDLNDEAVLRKACEGSDIVFHLASAHLDVSLPDSYYELVNVKATRRLVEIAYQSQIKKFIHCSSVGVIGDIKNPPADEETECFPTNIYEKTKLAGERSVLQFAEQVSLPLVVARPAWVYGPRCPRTDRLFRGIKKHKFILFGSCQNLRHPIYIKDAIRGLELCAETDHVHHQIFILAGKQPITVEQLISEIADIVGTKPPAIKLPLIVGLTAGYLSEVFYKVIKKKPPISRRSLDFFTKNNAYDISKAENMLHFTPQVNIRTGLESTYVWLSNNQ